MSESKVPPQTLSPDEARLLVYAACCVIAADGTIAQKERDALLAAMNRIGIPHDPKAMNAHVVAVCKQIHKEGVSACAAEAARQVAGASSSLKTALSSLTAELPRADGKATLEEIDLFGTVLESASHSAADQCVSGDQVEFGPLGDDDAAGKRNASSLGETNRFWPDLRDLNGAWLVGGLWSAIVIVTLVYSLVSNGPSLLHSASRSLRSLRPWPTRTIDVQVFITTKGRDNVKLGGAKIYYQSPNVLVEEINNYFATDPAGAKEALKQAMTFWESRQEEILELFEKERDANGQDESASVARRHKVYVGNFNVNWWSPYVSVFQHESQADADGRATIRLEGPGPWYLWARETRTIGQSEEEYIWLVGVPDTSSDTIYLTNDNLTTDLHGLEPIVNNFHNALRSSQAR